jgi:hypothetical protein
MTQVWYYYAMTLVWYYYAMTQAWPGMVLLCHDHLGVFLVLILEF